MKSVKQPCRLAVLIGAGMTVIFSVLRVLMLRVDIDAETGAYSASYWLIALMALFALAIGFLVFREKEVCPPLTGGRLALPGLMMVLTGAVIFLFTLVDFVPFLADGIAPAPLSKVQNGADRFCLWGGFLCGFAGGAGMAFVGVRLLKGGSMNLPLQIAVLMPTLWIWFRLARYELSYIGAMSVAQTFYDYVMLVFSLLFLLTFARYMAGIGAPKVRTVLFLSVTTAAFSISNVMTRLYVWLASDPGAFAASRLAGFPDMAVGLLALTVCFTFLEKEKATTWLQQQLDKE